MSKLIRFDWAIKKLLRNKANFDILEGFLTVVLNEKITILEIIESESNKDSELDKYNKVDILVKDSKGEFVIVEVQNSKEYDYFQRMLYGTSKVITEHIKSGESYSNVKKVYSITIAYFDLGQGDDYVYHGKTEFVGIHSHTKLELAQKQKELFSKENASDLFPEYWIIKADKFDDTISDKLDEWIYFLKNSEIPETFSAPGLKEAKERLTMLQMNEEELRDYNAYQKTLINVASMRFNEKVEIDIKIKEEKEKSLQKGIGLGIEKGIEQGIEKVAIELIKNGVSDELIANATKLSIAQIEELRRKMN